MTRRRVVTATAALGLVASLAFVLCRREQPSPRAAVDVPVAASSTRAPVVAGSAATRRGRPAPPLARLAMRGIVIDRDGAPVVDAAVVLARPSRTVRSGVDGRFEIVGLLPGQYAVEARSAGRIAGPLTIDLDASTGDVTLRMYAGFALEVEVVAADDNRPIAEAVVSVALLSMHAGAGRQHATTGRDGIARLDGMTYIGHDLHVAAPGFVDERRGPGPDLEERAPGIRRLRIALERAAMEVRGQLVDAAGAPVEGDVEAVVYQGGDRSLDEAKVAKRFGGADPHVVLRSSLGTRTDAQGAFRLGLATGTWVLVASAPQRETVVSDPIFVEVGGQRDIKLVLGAGRTLRGVVVDGSDREVGVPHIEVRWLDGERVLATSVADNNGGFEVRGLPAAPVQVIARNADARSRPLAVDLGAGDVDGAVVVLEMTGAITGRVVGSDGTAIPDAVVTYLDEDPGAKPTLYPAVTITDGEGRFRIGGVAPRVTYHVNAARPLDGGFGQHAAALRARAGDNVTITIPSGGAIIGRIVGAADPRALTVRDQQTLRTARPGSDGRFRIDRLPALRYQLRISGAGIADEYVQDVNVGDGRDTDIGDVKVRAGRRVAGLVLDTAARPVDDAMVRIEVDGKYAVTTRAAAGRFSLSVPAAPLVILATHLHAGRTAPLSIGSSTSASSLRLTMVPGGTIRGVVRVSGAGLADAPVTVWPVGPRPPEPVAATITDDAGAFAIPAVPAGRWLVEVGIPALEREHRVVQRGVEVAAGATADVEVDATDAPAGTIVQPRPELPELPTYGEDSDH